MKTQEQIDALQQEWDADTSFTKSRVHRLAQSLDLTTKQVYKWIWDKKKGFAAEREVVKMLEQSQNAFPNTKL